MIPHNVQCLPLSSEFEGIERKLQVLSERLRLQLPPNQVQDDEEVSRLLEDLQESIFNYQVCS